MRYRGAFTGQEFVGKGANVALGTVAGPLGRSPHGGRNWDGFSPNPYLTSVGMEETVIGVQSTDVQACSKHFSGNEQGIQRKPSPSLTANGTTIEAVSSKIDEPHHA